MKATMFLATLVAMCLIHGCVAVAGPQGCEFGTVGFGCAPNPDAGGDTTGYDGGDTTNTDNSADTSTTDTGIKLPEVCEPYRSQIEFLLNAGTWKMCVVNKTDGIGSLTFTQVSEVGDQCVITPVEGEAYSINCSWIVASSEKKFVAKGMECTK